MIRHACHAALAAQCFPVIAVLGSNSSLINQQLTGLPVSVALNAQWSEGIASSIRCGVEALSNFANDIAAVLLMLADQPLITSLQLDRLKRMFDVSGSPIVASEYHVGGQFVRGVPAIFTIDLFPELLQLRGDKGAQRLIEKYEAAASFVSISEAAIDIDTPHDLARVQARI